LPERFEELLISLAAKKRVHDIGMTRSPLISTGERTTSSNEPRMLETAGGGDGSVSVDGAGEGGDLAEVSGR
jgi:hypothetical protein